MFIQTEATPNPQTLKFIPGEDVLPGETRDFTNLEEAQISPLASRLMTIDGVSGVFLGTDFVSITKDTGEWQHLKPAILGVIMEHYLSGNPIITGQGNDTAEIDEFYNPEDEQTVAMIKELLDHRVRPAVAQDGGDIMFKGYKEGVVYLHMRGACQGCPSATATLKYGIENLLRHFIPDIVEVLPVE